MMRTSPQIQPGHLLNLIDDVGIVQHAYGTIPNRSSGYCVDDVARLVIAVVHLEHGTVIGTIAASWHRRWLSSSMPGTGIHPACTTSWTTDVAGRIIHTPVIIWAGLLGRSAW
jgi:hypothetical protein